MKKLIAIILLFTTALCFLVSCRNEGGNDPVTSGDAVYLSTLATHDDVGLMMSSGQIDVAILPEPKATVYINTAKTKGHNYRVALNLSVEWDEVSDYGLAMGCIAVNNSFIEQSEGSMLDFLIEYKESVNYINNRDNHEIAADMIASAQILPNANVAKSALNNLYGSIVYQDGEQMKATLKSFYDAIQIKQPSDSFYYSPTKSPDGTSKDKIKIAVMNGPTGMGMAKLMDQYPEGNDKYEFIIYPDPSLAISDLNKGLVDMACLPTNSVATLANKGAGIKVAAINCLGSLYVVAKDGVEINSIDDLKGKTVYYGVPTSTTEPIFAYILNKHSIEVKSVDEE